MDFEKLCSLRIYVNAISYVLKSKKFNDKKVHLPTLNSTYVSNYF